MVRADINLRLTDVENGRTLAAFTDNIKVGRPDLTAVGAARRLQALPAGGAHPRAKDPLILRALTDKKLI